jgi:hypothetical protein
MAYEPPPIDESLLRWLESVFPGRLPVDPTVPLDTLRHMQGQASVLRLLRSTYEDQNTPQTEED